MEMGDAIAIYAAILSTLVAVVQLSSWLRNRVDATLTVVPHRKDMKPHKFGHIELDVQATRSPITIRAIYLAGYKSWWHWLLRAQPDEVLGSDWVSIFPKTIEPGQGWDGMFAINERERALAKRCRHVRMTVRHTGFGTTSNRAVTKFRKY